MKSLALCALTLCMWTACTVLGLDALEWESTGQCRECVVLPSLRPDLVHGAPDSLRWAIHRGSQP